MKKILLLLLLSVAGMGGVYAESSATLHAELTEELAAHESPLAHRYHNMITKMKIAAPGATANQQKTLEWLTTVNDVLGDESLDEQQKAEELKALDKMQPAITSTGRSWQTWAKHIGGVALFTLLAAAMVKWLRGNRNVRFDTGAKPRLLAIEDHKVYSTGGDVHVESDTKAKEARMVSSDDEDQIVELYDSIGADTDDPDSDDASLDDRSRSYFSLNHRRHGCLPKPAIKSVSIKSPLPTGPIPLPPPDEGGPALSQELDVLRRNLVPFKKDENDLLKFALGRAPHRVLGLEEPSDLDSYEWIQDYNRERMSEKPSSVCLGGPEKYWGELVLQESFFTREQLDSLKDTSIFLVIGDNTHDYKRVMDDERTGFSGQAAILSEDGREACNHPNVIGIPVKIPNINNLGMVGPLLFSSYQEGGNFVGKALNEISTLLQRGATVVVPVFGRNVKWGSPECPKYAQSGEVSFGTEHSGLNSVLRAKLVGNVSTRLIAPLREAGRVVVLGPNEQLAPAAE